MNAAFGETRALSSHYVPSYEGHLVCIREGIGWAMMPTETVMPLVESGELKELLPNVRVRVPLFWQSRSQASVVLQSLASVVSSVAEKRLLMAVEDNAA